MLKGGPGSGKSTLMKIISGLKAPSEGAMYVNDISIRAICLEEFRNSIGQVLPEQTLFHGSILENITYGDPSITPERLHWALKNTGLLAYVREQPNGINTVVKSDGLEVPHTIAKRIAIAAAVVKKPKLLLLKDALEEFEADEAKKIISFLISPDKPWALLVSSRSARWTKQINKTIVIENGILTQQKN